MSKLHGRDAINHHLATGAELHKYSDPIEGARHDLSAEEAEAICAEDPNLVWCETSAEAQHNAQKVAEMEASGDVKGLEGCFTCGACGRSTDTPWSACSDQCAVSLR